MLRLAKLAIVGLLVWGIGSTVVQGIDELRGQHLPIDFAWLFVAGCLSLLGLFPCAVFWYRILWALGQRPTFVRAVRAYLIGHLGKYVPGKAMVVVLRASLISGEQVQTSVAAASVFFETLTMMAVGSFLAAGILWVLFPQHWSLILVAGALMLGSGLPTVPVVFRRLAQLALGQDKTAGLPLERITWRLVASGWIMIAGGWSLLGLSMWAVLKSIGAPGLDQWTSLGVCIASVALAVVAGFLSLIPGGAVVRELILTEVMAGPFGVGMALAAAVLMRLVWLAAEVVASAILYRI